jgi:hypothetical protein
VLRAKARAVLARQGTMAINVKRAAMMDVTVPVLKAMARAVLAKLGITEINVSTNAIAGVYDRFIF